MARAKGRPSPSTASQRCQARTSLMNVAHALIAFTEDATRIGVRVDRLPAGRNGHGGVGAVN